MNKIDVSRRNTLKGVGLASTVMLWPELLLATSPKEKKLIIASSSTESNAMLSKIALDGDIQRVDLIKNYHETLGKIGNYLSAKRVDSVVGVLSYADYILLTQALQDKSLGLKMQPISQYDNNTNQLKFVRFMQTKKKEKYRV